MHTYMMCASISRLSILSTQSYMYVYIYIHIYTYTHIHRHIIFKPQKIKDKRKTWRKTGKEKNCVERNKRENCIGFPFRNHANETVK